MKKILTLVVALFAVVFAVNAQGFNTKAKSQSKFVLQPADKSFTLFEIVADDETTYVLSLRDRQYSRIIEWFNLAIGTREDIIEFVLSCQECFDTFKADDKINVDSEYISFIGTTKIMGVKTLTIHSSKTNSFGYFYPQNMKRILKYFNVEDE